MKNAIDLILQMAAGNKLNLAAKKYMDDLPAEDYIIRLRPGEVRLLQDKLNLISAFSETSSEPFPVILPDNALSDFATSTLLASVLSMAVLCEISTGEKLKE